jgi:ATP-dependent helicase/nuclease subunit A
VLDRGIKGTIPAEGSVRPGLHKPRLGSHAVVCWDPAVLTLDVEEQIGLRQQRILEADEHGVDADRGYQNHARWREARSAALAQASRPSIRVQTVTALASDTSLDQAQSLRIQIETVPRLGSERPGGRRFGALVHAMLAVVDLNASIKEIIALAEANARLIDATRPEIDAAVRAVQAALNHPVMQRAALSLDDGSVRRETPIQLRQEGGSLVEGVVDLAFREETPEFTGWTVVDFKTDREIEKSRDRYAAQVAVYAEAIGISTRSPARGLLLIV